MNKKNTLKKKTTRYNRLLHYRLQGTINASGKNMQPRWRVKVRLGQLEAMPYYQLMQIWFGDNTKK